MDATPKPNRRRSVARPSAVALPLAGVLLFIGVGIGSVPRECSAAGGAFTRELVIPEPRSDVPPAMAHAHADRPAMPRRVAHAMPTVEPSGALSSGQDLGAAAEAPLRELVIPEPRSDVPPAMANAHADRPAMSRRLAHTMPKAEPSGALSSGQDHGAAAEAPLRELVIPEPRSDVPPEGSGPQLFRLQPMLLDAGDCAIDVTLDQWNSPLPRLGQDAFDRSGGIRRVAAAHPGRPVDGREPLPGEIRAQALSGPAPITFAVASQAPLELESPFQPQTQAAPLPPGDEASVLREESTGEAASDAGDGQTLGESQKKTVTEATEQRNLRFLRRQSILLDPGEYEFDVTLQYLVDEADFALARIEGNVLQIGEVTRRQRLLLLPIEFRLGLSQKTQAFVNVPFGWSNGEFAFLGDEEFDNAGGIGDVSTGITRLLHEGVNGTRDVLAALAFSAPTGRSDVVSALTVPGSSLGEGFWSLTMGLTFIQTYDPVVVFYGAGYRHRFDRTFDDEIAVSPGKQAYYRLGVGFAVNPSVTLSASFLGSYIGANKINGVRVAGGIQEPMQVRLAATVSKNKNCRPDSRLTTIEPFVNFGVSDDAVDSLFGISWTF